MNKIVNKVPESMKRLEAAVAKWTKKSGKTIRKELEREMRLPKSGATSGGHQASAPGEAPAIQTQELLDSYVFDTDFLVETLGSELVKAVALEKGADIKKPGGGSFHLDARPVLVKASTAVLPTLENSLDEACRKAQII